MSLVTPYVQLTDVITLLPGLQNTPGATAPLNLIAGAVSDLATQFTGRTFWIQSYTEQKKGRGQALVIPIQQPVQTITSVAIFGCGQTYYLSPCALDSNGVPITSGPGYWTGTDGDGNLTIYFSAVRAPDSVVPNVFLAYTAGFAALTGGSNNGPLYTALPQDFYQALCYECATRYKELSRLGAKQEVSGPGQSMVFNTGDLQPQTKSVLSRYKRSWFDLA